MDPYDLQPTLIGRRILLRPLEPDDWDALYAAARDPLIWAAHPAHDRWTEPVFRRYFADALASRGALVVVDTTNGEVIGSSRYELSRAGPGEVEIGWTFLVRSHWGGTTNPAMKRLMIAHALHDFERVVFMVGEGNVRSRRAMEKIGARLTARTLDTEMAGRVARHVIYAIDRQGFADGLLTRYPVGS